MQFLPAIVFFAVNMLRTIITHFFLDSDANIDGIPTAGSFSDPQACSNIAFRMR